ncbi:head protein [Asaia sp. W19]|uniref:Mu-like prophage major head subunit gpT family protein n=1 Tax=unclassified Asaia TaxID=2685023 RepID=UPI000F8E34FD|nr:Mu-like prophage major head subunit gpT family protein [Asaia sp. W19]RUT27393.1 head protein [Asaia sp. W19]
MQITGPNIAALSTAVSLAFNKAIGTAPSRYSRFAQVVPSEAGENFYPRLPEMPGMRKWIGSREIHQLSTMQQYAIRNETYEETIAIKREDIADDRWGVFMPYIEQLALDAAELPDQLCFGALENGTKTTCLDGQYFFDTDHQAVNANGETFTYPNMAGPKAGETGGPAWYLLCTTRALKPIIFQTRSPFTVTARTRLDSDNVFENREFQWGVDGRCAAGVGFWQFAYRSTRPLTIQSFGDAKAAMASLCRADGTPYGIVPDLLMVPSNLEQAGRTLLKAQLAPLSAGNNFATGTNPWIGAADLMVAERLSQLNG